MIRAIAALTLALGLAALPPKPAEARVYWEIRPLLGEFFKSSQRVTFTRVSLTRDERARIDRRLGYPLKRSAVTFYHGLTNGAHDGYVLIDDEIGQHQPITFATKLTKEGEVESVELVVYREPYGEGVAASEFRNQFRGKSAKDRLTVEIVSGATISSRSMQTGVRRALILYEELMALRRSSPHRKGSRSVGRRRKLAGRRKAASSLRRASGDARDRQPSPSIDINRRSSASLPARSRP